MDLQDDSEGYRELCDRLRPILGNLVEVQDSVAEGVPVETKTPSLVFAVTSFLNTHGTKFHGLVKYYEEP